MSIKKFIRSKFTGNFYECNYYSYNVLNFIYENKLYDFFTRYTYQEASCILGFSDLFFKFNSSGIINGINKDLLWFACQKGSVEFIHELFTMQNFDKGVRSYALGAACMGNNIPVIDYLIYNSDFTNFCYEDGLIGACKGNNIELVNKMISLGATNYSSALCSACHVHNIDMNIINLLLDKCETIYYNPCFINACESGSFDVIRLLWSINNYDKEHILDGFNIACKNGFYNIFEFLFPFVLSYENFNINFAIMMSLYCNNNSITDVLLKFDGIDYTEILQMAIYTNNYNYILNSKFIDNKFKCVRINNTEIIKLFYLKKLNIFFDMGGIYEEIIVLYYAYKKGYEINKFYKKKLFFTFQNLKMSLNNHLQKKI